MLLNHMGREKCLRGLQEFVSRYKGGVQHPLMNGFASVLREFADDPQAFDEFVEQWFDDVVLPEYRIENVRTDGNGADHLVRFRLQNAGTGSMLVTLAVTRGERFDSLGRALPGYREAKTTVVLGAGSYRDVEITCSFVPEEIVVDPDALVLQLGRSRARHQLQ